MAINTTITSYRQNLADWRSYKAAAAAAAQVENANAAASWSAAEQDLQTLKQEILDLNDTQDFLVHGKALYKREAANLQVVIEYHSGINQILSLKFVDTDEGIPEITV